MTKCLLELDPLSLLSFLFILLFLHLHLSLTSSEKFRKASFECLFNLQQLQRQSHEIAGIVNLDVRGNVVTKVQLSTDTDVRL